MEGEGKGGEGKAGEGVMGGKEKGRGWECWLKGKEQMVKYFIFCL